MSAHEVDRFDDEALASASTTPRNWRGIMIALLVIILVLGLIVSAVLFLTPPEPEPDERTLKISLEDLIGDDFKAKRLNGSWVSGNELMYKDAFNSIVIMNVSDLTTTIIMSNKTVNQLNLSSYKMSADQRYLLLCQNEEKVYRYSSKADYSFFDMMNQEIFPLSLSVNGIIYTRMDLVVWSPKGHAFAVVLKGDIYYKEDPRTDIMYRITDTAEPGVITNGIPDWLYEEEVLMSGTALWFAPDGKRMIFGSFNDKGVEEQTYQWYGTVDFLNMFIYPKMKNVRYPKPGTNNPEVTMFLADIRNLGKIKLFAMPPPIEFRGATDRAREYYVTGVTWLGPNEATVVYVSRLQDISIISLCRHPAWNCLEAHRLISTGIKYLHMDHPPLYGTDGNMYLGLAPVQDAPIGYYKHITAVNITSRNSSPITMGEFTVRKIVAWDHVNELVYYLGTPKDRSTEVHLYATISTVKKKSNLPIPHCITCPKNHADVVPEIPIVDAPSRKPRPNSHQKDPNGYYNNRPYMDDLEARLSGTLNAPPTTEPNTENAKPKEVEKFKSMRLNRPCTYHDATFSPSNEYFVVECLGPGIPHVTLHKVKLGYIDEYGNETKPYPTEMLTVLQNNTELRDKMAKVAMPLVDTVKITVRGGFNVVTRVYVPPILNMGEITRYPFILQVYNGPGSQQVTDRWKVDFASFLATNMNYIVALVDGRGSSGQGFAHEQEVHKRLGNAELEDLFDVLEYLLKNLHFIDKRRMAVWGWSYGGFLSTMLLATSDDKLFKCGIAVAPIVSWQIYDTVFTERFLGFPNVSNNYRGYIDADLTQYAHYLRSKSLYLIHGTADDNVHFQHSMLLAKSLADTCVTAYPKIFIFSYFYLLLMISKTS